MEFNYVNEIFKSPIVEINHSLIPPGYTGDRRALRDVVNKVSDVVNALGEASATAQGLTKPITTADRLRNSEHKLYFLIDQNANQGKGAITGMLKTGNKSLYVFDRDGIHYQVSPPCLLDFYIHESRQRNGLGKQLFEHMLQKEKIEPVQMAVDRPSEKLLRFLNRHYQLNEPVKQMNNYVVYDGFFPSREPVPQETDDAEDARTIANFKKNSANGLQAFQAPLGRYGAPRPPCSMGQIIHNQTPTIDQRKEASGVQSMPACYSGKPYSPQPNSYETQSAPNVYYGSQAMNQFDPSQIQIGNYQNVNYPNIPQNYNPVTVTPSNVNGQMNMSYYQQQQPNTVWTNGDYRNLQSGQQYQNMVPDNVSAGKISSTKVTNGMDLPEPKPEPKPKQYKKTHVSSDQEIGRFSVTKSQEPYMTYVPDSGTIPSNQDRHISPQITQSAIYPAPPDPNVPNMSIPQGYAPGTVQSVPYFNQNSVMVPQVGQSQISANSPYNINENLAEQNIQQPMVEYTHPYVQQGVGYADPRLQNAQQGDSRQQLYVHAQSEVGAGDLRHQIQHNKQESGDPRQYIHSTAQEQIASGDRKQQVGNVSGDSTHHAQQVMGSSENAQKLQSDIQQYNTSAQFNYDKVDPAQHVADSFNRQETELGDAKQHKQPQLQQGACTVSPKQQHMKSNLMMGKNPKSVSSKTEILPNMSQQKYIPSPDHFNEQHFQNSQNTAERNFQVLNQGSFQNLSVEPSSNQQYQNQLQQRNAIPDQPTFQNQQISSQNYPVSQQYGQNQIDMNPAQNVQNLQDVNVAQENFPNQSSLTPQYLPRSSQQYVQHNSSIMEQNVQSNFQNLTHQNQNDIIQQHPQNHSNFLNLTNPQFQSLQNQSNFQAPLFLNSSKVNSSSIQQDIQNLPTRTETHHLQNASNPSPHQQFKSSQNIQDDSNIQARSAEQNVLNQQSVQPQPTHQQHVPHTQQYIYPQLVLSQQNIHNQSNLQTQPVLSQPHLQPQPIVQNQPKILTQQISPQQHVQPIVQNQPNIPTQQVSPPQDIHNHPSFQTEPLLSQPIVQNLPNIPTQHVSPQQYVHNQTHLHTQFFEQNQTNIPTQQLLSQPIIQTQPKISNQQLSSQQHVHDQPIFQTQLVLPQQNIVQGQPQFQPQPVSSQKNFQTHPILSQPNIPAQQIVQNQVLSQEQANVQTQPLASQQIIQKQPTLPAQQVSPQNQVQNQSNFQTRQVSSQQNVQNQPNFQTQQVLSQQNVQVQPNLSGQIVCQGYQNQHNLNPLPYPVQRVPLMNSSQDDGQRNLAGSLKANGQTEQSYTVNQAGDYLPQQSRLNNNVTSKPRVQSAAEKFKTINHERNSLSKIARRHINKLTQSSECDLRFGYPPQMHDDVHTDEGGDIKQPTPQKLERPRSLIIQQEEPIKKEDEQIEEKELEDLGNEPSPVEDVLDSLEAAVEQLDLSQTEQIKVKGATENFLYGEDDGPSPRKTPSHLTDQGYFDLKFYHNKLW